MFIFKSLIPFAINTLHLRPSKLYGQPISTVSTQFSVLRFPHKASIVPVRNFSPFTSAPSHAPASRMLPHPCLATTLDNQQRHTIALQFSLSDAQSDINHSFPTYLLLHQLPAPPGLAGLGVFSTSHQQPLHPAHPYSTTSPTPPPCSSWAPLHGIYFQSSTYL